MTTRAAGLTGAAACTIGQPERVAVNGKPGRRGPPPIRRPTAPGGALPRVTLCRAARANSPWNADWRERTPRPGTVPGRPPAAPECDHDLRQRARPRLFAAVAGSAHRDARTWSSRSRRRLRGKAPVGVAVGAAIYQDVLSASAGRALLSVGSGHASPDSTLIAANTVGLLVAIRPLAELCSTEERGSSTNIARDFMPARPY